MNLITRREAIIAATAIGLTSTELMSAEADAKPTEASRDTLIYGVRGCFVGNEWIMEVNCDDPTDPEKACDPNCCVIIPRQLIRRLMLVGFCGKLPGISLKWRVIVKDEHKTSKNVAKIGKLDADTVYYLTPDGGTEIFVEVSL